jgi:hypothetical protein
MHHLVYPSANGKTVADILCTILFIPDHCLEEGMIQLHLMLLGPLNMLVINILRQCLGPYFFNVGPKSINNNDTVVHDDTVIHF